jgi:hypothetical protein
LNPEPPEYKLEALKLEPVGWLVNIMLAEVTKSAG